MNLTQTRRSGALVQVRNPFIAIFLILFAVLTACMPNFSDARTVYVTKTGSKYHKETCHYLKSSKLSLTLSEAKEKDYTPCKVCKPTTNVTSTSTARVSNVSTIQKKPEVKPQIKCVTSQQCAATAKSTGNRCKRMTKNASGKCWQHE